MDRRENNPLDERGKRTPMKGLGLQHTYQSTGLYGWFADDVLEGEGEMVMHGQWRKQSQKGHKGRSRGKG
jgi:hypothetical protein